jgi:hypothetical protein
MRSDRIFALVLGVAALLSPSCGTAPSGDILAPAWWLPSTPPPAGDVPDLQFAFVCRDVRTNQHLAGQRNTIFCRYAYRGVLASSPVDLPGREVSSAAYPYYQTIRDDLLRFLVDYPDKTAFYENLVYQAAQALMDKYDQLRWIQISIVAEAHPLVAQERAATITLTRPPQ